MGKRDKKPEYEDLDNFYDIEGIFELLQNEEMCGAEEAFRHSYSET